VKKNWELHTFNTTFQDSLERMSIGDLDIEFEIRRVFYMYNVANNEIRGQHAHYSGWQILVALQGSFEISLYDGHLKESFDLKEPYRGLLIGPMVWRELYNFTQDAFCLVLNTEKYEEKNTIRSYEEFNRLAHNTN